MTVWQHQLKTARFNVNTGPSADKGGSECCMQEFFFNVAMAHFHSTPQQVHRHTCEKNEKAVAGRCVEKQAE